ncbi:transporter substrate-binding domain-containing protein [Pseudophaeobacter sp.]|uniref:substrate-binding periplasmic protein n=1 Tax=Pseudophaeobacter sp. TaxID=1971739 RepID=UPI003296CB9A
MDWLRRIVTSFGALGLLTMPLCAETWVAGSMEGFAPFNYSVGDEYAGIDVQIMNEAAARIGVELEHRPMPWKRVLLAFESGELDVIFQLAPSPERFANWHMVGPLRRTRTVFVTTSDSPIQDITELEDLEGLMVGVVAGFIYEEAFDNHPDLLREESLDDFTNIRKLLLGRSDLVVGGYATLLYVASELNALEKLRFLPTPLSEYSRYVGFPRTPRGKEMAERLQKELNLMQASGRMDSILRSHLAR